VTRLHLAPGIPPVGAPMADLAVLWCDLLDGMDLDDLFHVVMSPNGGRREGGGQITAHFLDSEAMRKWAKHYGLNVTADPGGSWIDLIAAGPVTRNGRTAELRLRSTEIERDAA
jgi:hypothetical protein